MADANHELEVFWISGSPFAWRALLALEIKGLPYVSRLLEASKGEHKTPAYLALNPRGKVPTLRHGATVVPESIAIMAYLDRQYPNPPLFGTTADETARVWQAVSECVYYVEGPIADAVRPIFFGADKAHENWNDRVQAAHAELERLDKHLQTADWLAVDTVSAADLATYPFVRLLLRAAERAHATRFDLGLTSLGNRYPRLATWMARVEALPGFGRTFPPHWRSAAAA